MTDELLVKNDYLMFDGSVVLSDEISKKSTPNPNPSNMVHSTNLTHDKVLLPKDKLLMLLKIMEYTLLTVILSIQNIP